MSLRVRDVKTASDSIRRDSKQLYLCGKSSALLIEFVKTGLVELASVRIHAVSVATRSLYLSKDLFSNEGVILDHKLTI